MIEYAKSKGVIDIMLHTNGTVMTEEQQKDNKIMAWIE